MSTTTMKWSQRDVECAARILGSASAEGTPLPTLTDEEVVALDGIQHEQIVALPWLSVQDAGKDIMCAIALRGLLAKELAYPVIFEGETEPSRLHATEEITGALTLRRSADTVVSIERTVSTGKRWLYAYVHVEGVLLEEIDEGGLHGFTVVTRDALTSRLVAFVDPEGSAVRDGDATSYSDAEFESQAPSVLADTRAASNVVSFSTGSDDLPTVTVYTGPSGVRILTPHVQGGSVTLEVREASPSTLAGVLASLAAIA
jgi:hypothetical protein